MTVRDEYLFVGGDPALDFVNTEIVRDGEPVDLLTDAAALERWLHDAGFGRVRVTPSAFQGAKRLRAALRKIVDGASSSVNGINEELRRGQGTLTLRKTDGKYAVEFQPRDADPRFLIARAAANFLASADLARIRRCEGTNCILFFYDTTKSGTRRWCSMAGCGNRMKAAAHYRRMKDEG